MKMRLALVGLASLVISWSVVASAATETEKQIKASSVRTAKAFGVDHGTLMSFAREVRAQAGLVKTAAAGSAADGFVTTCLQGLVNTDDSRSRMLACLEKGVGRTWHLNHLSEITALNAAIVGQISMVESAREQREIQKTYDLLLWLENIVRDIFYNSDPTGELASLLWAKDQGVKNVYLVEMQVEEGDILLNYGAEPISAMIARSPSPYGYYSHAMVVSKERGRLIIVESSSETGVTKRSLREFLGEAHSRVTLLRWRDPSTRAEAVRVISETAYAQLGKKYDMRMDLDMDGPVYCSELAIRSLRAAALHIARSNVAWSKVAPVQGTLYGDRRKEFISRIGIQNSKFVAPSDLVFSPLLEITAQFRSADGLLADARTLGMADAFMRMTDDGASVKPPKDDLSAGLVFLARRLDSALRLTLGRDRQMIPAPEEADSRMIVDLYYLTKKVFPRLQQQVDQKLKPLSISTAFPWDIEGHMMAIFKEDREIRLLFR